MNWLKIREATYRFSLLGTSFIVAFVLAGLIGELAFRWIRPLPPFRTSIPLRPNSRMELHTDLRGVATQGIHTTNSWGFRGDAPPKDWNKYYTIIAVGGSTTQCFYLDDEKTWPRLLEKYLTSSTLSNFWIGNGGTDGQTTRAHL